MKLSQSLFLSVLRISLGFIFFWSFVDKVFGLNFSTTPDKSWLQGNSPTSGFLQFGTHGTFSSFFQNLSGNSIVDWLFMLGLCFIGISLMFGIGIRIATISGSILMFLIWLSVFPPKQNPFIDEHIIYIIALFTILYSEVHEQFGLSKWWSNTSVVKRYQILK